MTVHRQQLNNLPGYLYELTGETSAEDLIGISDELRAREETVFAVLDFSGATLEKLTLQDVHRIAIRDTSFPETHSFEKLALVGLKGPGRWLAETYKFFTENWISKNHQYETGLFDNLEQAKEWFGTGSRE